MMLAEPGRVVLNYDEQRIVKTEKLWGSDKPRDPRAQQEAEKYSIRSVAETQTAPSTRTPSFRALRGLRDVPPTVLPREKSVLDVQRAFRPHVMNQPLLRDDRFVSSSIVAQSGHCCARTTASLRDLPVWRERPRSSRAATVVSLVDCHHVALCALPSTVAEA